MKELIRNDHFIHRKSIRQIARERHLSRKTIRAALRDAGPTVYKRTKPPNQRVMGAFVPILERILEEDKARPPKQRHTAHRIYERLRDENGFTGGESTVRTTVRQLRPKLKDVFLPLEFDPGQDAQVDWGDADVIMDGVQVTVQMFCFKLRASGAFFVACFPTQKQEALFEGHVRAFLHFGGVARRATYDNMKTAVLKVLTGKNRTEQEDFVAFRSHYLFESHFCTPGLQGAHEKGGVEHLVGYARRNFLVPLPEVSSFDELNRLILARCIADRDRELPGDRGSIAEALQREIPQLLPLPNRQHDCCKRHAVKADAYAMVGLDTNRYSVPVERARQSLTLKAFVDRIEIVAGDRVIAEHVRSYGRHEEIFNPHHYLPLLLERPGALKHAKPIRRWQWPSVYDRYLAKLQEHVPEGRGGREFVRILALHRDYSTGDMEVAFSLALEYRIYGHDAFKNLLLNLVSPPVMAHRLELIGREVLAQVKVGDFRTDQYNRLLAGGEP